MSFNETSLNQNKETVLVHNYNTYYIKYNIWCQDCVYKTQNK